MADAWEAIQTTTLTGTQTSVTFPVSGSLSTDYQHLMIKMTVRTDLNTTPGYDYVAISFNGTTGDWDMLDMHAAVETSGSPVGYNSLNLALGRIGVAMCDPTDDLAFGCLELVIPNYQSTNQFHGFQAIGGMANSAWGYNSLNGGTWHASTAAITSITLEPKDGTNFVSGCVFTMCGLRGS